MSDSTKRQRIDRAHWRPTDLLHKYTPQPTPGTTPLINTYYADFYPTTQPLPECQLNERTIRYGYLDTPLVDNEYMSCRDLIYDRLQDKRVFQELQQFAAITAQRQRTRGRLDSSKLPTFPLANRKSKSEEWQIEWIRQLSNCQVPLSILANTVPQGMKANRLLECLQREKIGVYRALWAIKVLGMYEMMGKHPGLDHKELVTVGPQYTLQWTKQFIQFLEHTLSKALDNTRDWQYCQTLLHQQYDQGLLDQRHTVSWMTNQLKTLSVDKQMILLPLIVEYTGEIAKSRTPLRKLISGVVYAVEQTAKYQSLRPFNERLRRYMKMLFDRYPDAFVEPTTWQTYKTTLGDQTREVEERNSRFSCFDDKSKRVVEIRQTQQATVLDQLRRPDFIELTTKSTDNTIQQVCRWAIEGSLSTWMSQYRFQAAANLCRKYKNDTIQRDVVEFLDTYRTENTREVCGLLEVLCQAGWFSISQYLEVLTARGDFFGNTLETTRSQRHLQYVLGVPISMEGGEQRRMLLYDCQMSPNEEVGELRELLAQQMPFMVAYTCGTLVRAARNQQPGNISQEVVDWWMAGRKGLPTANQLSKAQLTTEKAQTECLKDWISPLLDNIQDESVLSKWSDRLTEVLANSSRHLVDLAVNQRFMPMVYDYVVKDVKVGEDNWRVITKPGTSLLNRRQTASVVRVLIDAQLFGALLEFLLWMLSHSTLPDVIQLVHHMLRRYRSTWRRMGKLGQQTVDRVEKAYRSNEILWLVYEYLRTAQHWEAQSLVDTLQKDYNQYTSSHIPELLMQSGGTDNHTVNVRKEILELSQQLVRDRMSSGTVEELEWNVVPCFQRLGQWAFTKCQQQRNSDIPFSIAGQETKLRTMFEIIAVEATQMVGQAPRDMARWEAETSARFVGWFAVNSGLPKDYMGEKLLSALSKALKGYTGDQQTLMVGMETWVGRLVAYGCLRLAELVPWLIDRCRESLSANESAGLAGIVGMSLEETGQVYERLEMGGCWTTTLEDNRQLRIQTIEAIFLCASVAGQLRAQNVGLLAQLMGNATAGLAQSEWVQQLVVDQIPFSQPDMELAQGTPAWQCYYTMLEIYRANIEAQIKDPQMPLAVKRSVLRTLMTLCEGKDPEADGFVGMTRLEISHRLRETVRRFWQGSGEVAKTATLMNALLLFAETALKESEEALEEEGDVVGLLSSCVLEIVNSRGSAKRSKGLAEALATLPMEVLEGLVERGLNMLQTQDMEKEDGLVCVVQRLVAKLALSDNMKKLQEISNDILGQLQCICQHINPHVSSLLSIPPSTLSVDTSQLPTAVHWRIQASQSLCQLMRKHPDEFMVGEWLRTIVCLCLSDSLCQGRQLYQYMLDFAAITSESMTASQRKSTLECLRSVQPLLYSIVCGSKDVQTLGRLFPFDTTTRMTQGTDIASCPWTWIEALEFMPLAPLNNSTQLIATALESMTAFTLRGMVQRETSGQMAGGRLQYLENPYFPLQPVFGFPLAETPLPWQMFGGKRRRLDGESRLVWKYHCQAAFNQL